MYLIIPNGTWWAQCDVVVLKYFMLSWPAVWIEALFAYQTSLSDFLLQTVACSSCRLPPFHACSLRVVKPFSNLWSIENQRPTPAEVKRPTGGIVVPKKCHNYITAIMDKVCFSQVSHLTPLTFTSPVFPDGRHSQMLFLPSFGGLTKRRGGGGISCISPLLPKQHVSLFGLVWLA